MVLSRDRKSFIATGRKYGYKKNLLYYKLCIVNTCNTALAIHIVMMTKTLFYPTAGNFNYLHVCINKNTFRKEIHCIQLSQLENHPSFTIERSSAQYFCNIREKLHTCIILPITVVSGYNKHTGVSKMCLLQLIPSNISDYQLMINRKGFSIIFDDRL